VLSQRHGRKSLTFGWYLVSLLRQFYPGFRYAKPNGLIFPTDRSFRLLPAFLCLLPMFVCDAQTTSAARTAIPVLPIKRDTTTASGAEAWTGAWLEKERRTEAQGEEVRELSLYWFARRKRVANLRTSYGRDVNASSANFPLPRSREFV
jgi:hypothetical protein